ncbi:MAG: LapA family protein [Acidimicrobiia bacterium]|jgi:uncharacterized integral membrane protein
MTDEQPQNIKSTNDRIGIAIIVAVLVVLILGIFVWQNRDNVEIEFLFLGLSLPLWAIVGIFMALGALLGWVWRWVMRRRAGKRRSAR